MSEHTPGPTAEELLAIVAERDHLRAVNADLLAALEAVLPVAEVSYDGDPWFWDDGGVGERQTGLNAEGRFALARAAIAKAKGGGNRR